MKCMALLPLMLAEPSIWRRYHSPRVSPTIDLRSKVSTPSGKWPHMMTEWVHRLRMRLAVALAARVLRKDGPGQQRVDDVVLRHLVADLLQRDLGARLELGVRAALLGREVLAELEVVGRDAVLEEAGVDEVPQRLGRVEGHPALVLVDAHDAVAEVVVLADDVGVGVVQLVVRVLPLLRRARVVPLPGRRVDLGVTHPVPLAVHDVVPDLHVLDDLGDREAGGAGDPGRREHRDEQDGTAAELELALHVDDLADVGRVVGSAGVDHRLADRVELDTELLDVLGA